MAQRLNLARLLLGRPKLLLLDEPGTGLDTASRGLLHEMVREARDGGAAVIWISHDLDADGILADRILTLRNKPLESSGLPGPTCRELHHAEACRRHLSQGSPTHPDARSRSCAGSCCWGCCWFFCSAFPSMRGERLAPQAAATMFWLASAFCQVLVFNMLYALEH